MATRLVAVATSTSSGRDVDVAPDRVDLLGSHVDVASNPTNLLEGHVDVASK